MVDNTHITTGNGEITRTTLKSCKKQRRRRRVKMTCVFLFSWPGKSAIPVFPSPKKGSCGGGTFERCRVCVFVVIRARMRCKGKNHQEKEEKEKGGEKLPTIKTSQKTREEEERGG
jgi:hypothetical protein